VGIVASEAPCVAAATYTRNRVPGASLVMSKQHLSNGKAQAIVANAGCANAATGKQGKDDAIRMAQLTARKLGIDPHDVVVASTGVIGTYLPMDRIEGGIERLALTSDGGLTTATDDGHRASTYMQRNWSIGGRKASTST
jgi:glutamate N-acetyltransferase/amino-acid N-acetyltransferase